MPVRLRSRLALLSVAVSAALASAAFLACSSTNDTKGAGGGDAGDDGGSAGQPSSNKGGAGGAIDTEEALCATKTTCGDCLATPDDSHCAWCEGKCQVQPDGSKTDGDDGAWCGYGFTKTDPKVCTEIDGGAQLPTTLDIDCRSAKNEDDVHCKYADHGGDDDTTGKIGKGDVFPGGLGELRGGFYDAANNRLVLGAYFNGGTDKIRHGAIFTVDLATGDRKVVSGTYTDGQDTDQKVGDGDDIPGVADVKPSPDGKTWYALTGHAGNVGDAIFSIDPTTGKRAVVFDAQDEPQYDGTNKACFYANENWGVINVLGAQTLAIAPDGTMYVASGNPIAPDGELDAAGVAAIKPDGSCKLVSISSSDDSHVIGKGPKLAGTFEGLVLAGNTLYGEVLGEIFSVDVTTGDRKLVSSRLRSPQVGDGGPLQDGYLGWKDDAHTTLLVSGPSSTNGYEFHAFSEVDVATGDRTERDWVGPPFPASLNEQRWLTPHATLPGIYIVVIENAVLLFEPKTGASKIISH